MIFWVFGQRRSGKTTQAKKLLGKNTVFLDSDWMKQFLPGLERTDECDYEKGDYEQLALLARKIEAKGYLVVVAATTPYESLRAMVKKITSCTFLYITHNDFEGDSRYPFHPGWCEANFIIRRKEDTEREEMLT